jgi:hypothetical protein
VRTAVLNDTLEDAFRRRYPDSSRIGGVMNPIDLHAPFPIR